MADPTPATPASQILKEGGVGTAVSYFALTGSTEWLGLLPALPEGDALPMTIAGGAICAGIGRAAAWTYRNWLKRSTTNA